MSESVTKPAQFRLPAWAHEFIAQEASEQGVTKTEIVTEALEAYRRVRLEESPVRVEAKLEPFARQSWTSSSRTIG